MVFLLVAEGGLLGRLSFWDPIWIRKLTAAAARQLPQQQAITLEGEIPPGGSSFGPLVVANGAPAAARSFGG